MAIPLTEPPKTNPLAPEWTSWVFRLFRHVRTWTLVTETSGDADSAISPGVGYHGVTALSAGHVKTLPDTAVMDDGRVIIVQDESGSAGSNTITIQPQGSDTVNGTTSATITTNYGRLTVIKRGAGKYFAK